MADFHVIGHISNIKYLPDCILVYIDENKSGYRKSNGDIVDDRVLSWKCIFSGNDSKRSYIDRFFNRGMLVQVKGELIPYSVENGKMCDGYSVFIQTINRFAYPTTSVKREQRLVKDSRCSEGETPDIESFNSPDF